MSAPLPGLCGECRHARAIVAPTGATFYQCRLAETDARFDKWPRLPVLTCAGHERGDGEAVV